MNRKETVIVIYIPSKSNESQEQNHKTVTEIDEGRMNQKWGRKMNIAVYHVVYRRVWGELNQWHVKVEQLPWKN